MVGPGLRPNFSLGFAAIDNFALVTKTSGWFITFTCGPAYGPLGLGKPCVGAVPRFFPASSSKKVGRIGRPKASMLISLV